MPRHRFSFIVSVCLLALLSVSMVWAPAVAAQEATEVVAPGTAYASGLDNPRGLTFGPDGNLYVAEAGQGGTTISTTAADCDQVVEPVGPYTAGEPTSRVSSISPDGMRTTVVDGLPTSQTSPNLGGLVSGASDIAFLGDTLYILTAGAGCSHGVKDAPNAVLRVNDDGTTTQIADLSAFLMANPVKSPQPADFEPDGTPYSMIAVDGNLYVIEPNHGELDRVTPDGEISRVIDISASAGHIVPTSVVYHDDHFYIGNLSIFPVTVGAAGITEVSADREFLGQTLGLAMVTGIAFDDRGQLYALEASTVDNSMPVPGTGRVVRVNLETGDIEEVAAGLTFPTAMTFGPDGALYVSNFGFGFPPGSGEIRRIELSSGELSATLLVSGLEGGSGSTVGPDGALYVPENAAGKISRVDPETGEVTEFASGLPKTVPEVGIGGIMDVAFMNGTAYALVTLVSEDVGGTSIDGIYRIDGPDSSTVIADIGQFSMDNPPVPAFFVPTGVQYAMEVYNGGFLVTDGHHNRVLQVSLDGDITELIAFDDIVPTGLEASASSKTIYMTEAGPVPHLPENGKVMAFEPGSSTATEVASGARLLVDVEYGCCGTLYALAQGFFVEGHQEGSPAEPNTGSLVRVNADGTVTPLVDGLNQPTSFEFIGDTAYVITLSGEIWKIEGVSR